MALLGGEGAGVALLGPEVEQSSAARIHEAPERGHGRGVHEVVRKGAVVGVHMGTLNFFAKASALSRVLEQTARISQVLPRSLLGAWACRSAANRAPMKPMPMGSMVPLLARCFCHPGRSAASPRRSGACRSPGAPW